MKRDITLHVSTAEMPTTVRGVSVPKRGGCKDEFLIILNECLSDTEKTAAFLHECLHLWHRDHEAVTDVDLLEKIRHDELREIAQGLD